jgi:hypothetical protein
MTEIQIIETELSSNCVCEDYDEDTDTTTASTECWGCWSDGVADFKDNLLQPWLDANGWDLDTAIRINGTAMGWQRRSGYKDTTASELLDGLTLNGDFTLRFKFDGKDLACVRSSHDEPTGASFEFGLAPDDDGEE